MAAIGLLQALKSKRKDNVEEEVLEYEWGSSKVLNELDLTTLSRSQLRNHLEARDVDASGTKNMLLERLQDSLEEERLQSIAYTEALESEFQISKDLEERGSVYAVGTGGSGQLGQGDLEPRNVFTVIPKAQGASVCFVSTGYDMVFAVTEDHEVMVWGGSGVGPSGIAAVPVEEQGVNHEHRFMEPRIVSKLDGEEVMQVECGASHAVARSQGGDCFVWGFNKAGQLGTGEYERHDTPEVLDGIQVGLSVTQVAVGQNHTFAIANNKDVNRIYCWGHVADGRLGLGTRERVGAKEAEKNFFHAPALVDDLIKEHVLQVACGPEHTLVRTTTGVFSWGHGAGGRLGHGDTIDVYKPRLIEAFEGQVALDISCGTWHSAAIIMIPPMMACGEVWTWGSGYHGQLGQGNTQMSLKPTRITEISSWHVYAKSITCGSHHNAMIAHDGELWTWGSNMNNCLGREIDEMDVVYTPVPGHCGGFGSIVERVGRGMVRSVACGKEFTIVATYPYEGPSENVAKKLMEEEDLRAEEARIREDEEKMAREAAEKKRIKDDEKAARLARRQQGREAALALENGSAENATAAGPQPDASLILDKNMGSRKGAE